MSDPKIGPAVQRLLDRLEAIALSLSRRSGVLAFWVWGLSGGLRGFNVPLCRSWTLSAG